MKILFLTDRFPPFYEGGYEIMCQRVAEGLISRKHEILVLTTRWGITKNLEEPYVRRQLSFRSVQSGGKWARRIQDLSQILYNRKDYSTTCRVVKDFSPDLVFVWHMLGTTLMPLFAVQDMNLPMVFMIGSTWLITLKNQFENHTSYLKEKYWLAVTGFRKFSELKYKKAIMVSNSILEMYKTSGIEFAQKVVIPNGIPQGWMKETGRDSTNLVINNGGIQSPEISRTWRILIAGRYEPEKGLQIALQALRILNEQPKSRHIILDLAGKGEEAFIDEMKLYIQENHLEEVVRWRGFWSSSELRSNLPNYDLLLFPSIAWEGFGMTIIEAMSQGVPVIASDVGGPGDIIEDGRNGFLVPPGSAQELASAMERIMQSPHLEKRMIRDAIRTVNQKYIFENNLTEYEEFLKTCQRNGLKKEK
jgi:glycosyltransferase involved in cell wall biosynthesis